MYIYINLSGWLCYRMQSNSTRQQKWRQLLVRSIRIISINKYPDLVLRSNYPTTQNTAFIIKRWILKKSYLSISAFGPPLGHLSTFSLFYLDRHSYPVKPFLWDQFGWKDWNTQQLFQLINKARQWRDQFSILKMSLASSEYVFSKIFWRVVWFRPPLCGLFSLLFWEPASSYLKRSSVWAFELQ